MRSEIDPAKLHTGDEITVAYDGVVRRGVVISEPVQDGDGGWSFEFGVGDGARIEYFPAAGVGFPPNPEKDATK